MKKVGDIALIVSGYAFDSKLFNNDRKGVPLIRIRDVGKSSSETFYSGSFKEAYLVENGDFLIGMDGEFRLAEWKGEKALLNQRVCKVDPIVAKVWKRYLLYALPKELKRIEDVTPFVTVKHLSVKQIKDIQIPLPPLETQKKIAEILDTADTLRQKDKALIEKYNQLTQSLFLEMFGDPVRNEKGWETGKFSEIGCLDRGISKHRPRNAPQLLGGKYPLIQTGDVANSGIYINSHTSTYSEIGLKQSKLWESGTLCITIAANIAKTGILNFDACFPDSIVGFKPNEKSNSIYVYFWIGCLQKSLEESAPESAQKNINLRILRELNVPIPPIKLQNKFASMVEEIEKQKQLAEENQKKSEALFNSLLQRAFKGELV